MKSLGVVDAGNAKRRKKRYEIEIDTYIEIGRLTDRYRNR